MLRDPKISVIVPVYNSEKYIFKTLDSLAKQVFKDFEVIIVNDGSTDGSARIINLFCEKYQKFRCINIKNSSGVSNARNVGINASYGEYLAFVDSDDFVAPNFLQELYMAITENHADIACCNYYLYFPKHNVYVKNPFALKSESWDAHKLLNLMIQDVRIHFYLWNKLWKKSLFIDNNILLPDMCFEDIAVSSRLFYHAKTIAVKSAPLYYYTQRTGSLGSSITKEKFDDYILAFASIRNFLEIKNDFKNYRLSYSWLGYRIIITSIKLLANIHIKDKNFRSILKEFKCTRKKISYLIGKNFHIDKKIEIFLNEENKKYEEKSSDTFRRRIYERKF